MRGLRMNTVKTDFFEMDYIKFGHGNRILVIIPGLSVQSVLLTADAIEEAYRMFTDDYTVYLFDRRKDLPDVYSVHDMAKDTAAAFKMLGLDQVYLFGVSQGGMISLNIAIDHPEIIQKLAVGSTAACLDDEHFQISDRWIRLAKAGKATELYLAFGEAIYPQHVYEQSQDLLMEAAKTVTGEDLHRFIVLAEGTRGLNITEDLVKITCPVLYIGSRDDRILGTMGAEQLAQQLNGRPDFEMYMYDNYGHAAYDIAPDYKERVLEFFA